MPELIIREILTVIRYQPMPAYVDRVGTTVQPFTPEFSKWKLGTDGVYRLVGENRELFACTSHMGMRYDLPRSIDSIKEKLTKDIPSLLTSLGVDKVNFIGIRTKAIIPCGPFTDIVNSFWNDLIQTEHPIWSTYGEEPYDIGFPLVFHFGETRCTATFGPMEQWQMKEMMDNTSDLPESGIYIDFDMINKDKPTRDVRNIIKSSLDKTKDLLERHYRTISEQKRWSTWL